MVAWPGSLPQSPLLGGFDENKQDGVLRTEMDAGPKKARRKFSATVKPTQLRMIMTTAQLATLETFFDVTVSQGATVFDFNNPITGALKQYRFSNPYRVSPITGDKYMVAMSWEQQP